MSTHNYAVDKDTLKKLSDDIETQWDDPNWDRRVAMMEAIYLSKLRRSNGRKKWLLNASIALQIVGVTLIVVTTVIIVGTKS